MNRKFLHLLILATLTAGCGSSGRQPGEFSLPLPAALTKAAVAGDLEAHLIATNGTETKSALMTIADGQVSGTLNLKPGTWTLEIQFFQVASSGNLLPIAFISFGSREIGKDGMTMSYDAADIKFNESEGIQPSVSSSVEVPSGCVARFDCDSDGYSNFEEIKNGSNPEDATSLPESRPIITVNLEEGAVIRDVVAISATATDVDGVQSLVLNNPQGILDTNAPADAFEGSWDTTSLADGAVTLTFVATDSKGNEGTLTRTVQVDNVPNIVSFGTSQLMIQSGESATLSWGASNFTLLQLDNPSGAVANNSSLSVSPTTTTTYRLTAYRSNASSQTFTATQEVTITVNHAPTFDGHTTTLLGQDPAGGTTVSFSRSDSDAGETLTATATLFKSGDCAGTPVTTGTSTGGSVNFSSLDPRTDYSYMVSINDGRGGTASGACQLFTTADTGLVGWWRMDEGSGTNVADWSGTGHDLTLQQGASPALPEWVPGVLDEALGFDGGSNHLRNPTRPDGYGYVDLGFGNAWTISFWVNLGGDAGNLQTFFSIGNMSGVYDGTGIYEGDIRRDYIMARTGFNRRDIEVIYRGDDATVPEFQFQTPDGVLVANTWQHVTITYSGGTDLSTFRIYLNGIEQALLPNGASVPPQAFSGSRRLMVGRDLDLAHKTCGIGGNQECALYGKVDEFAIYNTALSVDGVRRECRISGSDLTTCPNPKSPIILTPRPGQVLPPTRAYWSWRGERGRDGTLVNPGLNYQATYDYDAGNDGSFTPPIDSLNNLADAITTGVARLDVTNNSEHFLIATTPIVNANKGYRLRITPIENGTTLTQFESTRTFSTDNSVVAWWRLDDDINSGPNFPYADDSISGAVNVGTLRNFSFTSTSGWIVEGGSCGNLLAGELLGGGLCFDGEDDVVSFGDILDGMSEVTVEARLKTTDDWGFIVNKRLAGADSSYFLYLYNGRGYFLTTTSSGSIDSYAGFINDGNWHHLVGTYDGATQSIFVDGVVGEAEAQTGGIKDTIHPLCIGAQCDTSSPPVTSDPFMGLLDEVLIYNQGLSNATVLNKYCADEAVLGTNPLPTVCLGD